MVRGRSRIAAARRQRAALGLLLAATALYALFLFLRSDRFVVHQVTVTGTRVLGADEVRRAAGLDRPLLLWQVWPPLMERRLREHPRVAAARVRPVWPDRVRVEVEERQPVAYLVLPRGLAEVDAAGQVLALVPTVRGAGEPLITGVEGAGLRPGARVAEAAAARGVAVAAALGPAGRAAVSEIHLTPAGEVVLYTVAGLPVFLGVEERWEDKARALLGLLPGLPPSGEVLYVDLRSLQRPVVRMRDPARAAAPPAPAQPLVPLP